MSHQIVLKYSTLEDFARWTNSDRTLYERINSLIQDISRSPFTGLGNPVPLEGDLEGYWSRRIDDVYRLVYKVTSDTILVELSQTLDRSANELDGSLEAFLAERGCELPLKRGLPPTALRARSGQSDISINHDNVAVQMFEEGH